MSKFDFDSWIKDNQHIYDAFEFEALQTAKTRKHYSAKTIVEYLRHHSLIKENGAEWKINNYATSYLARLFAYRNPSFKHFFEYRGMK